MSDRSNGFIRTDLKNMETVYPRKLAEFPRQSYPTVKIAYRGLNRATVVAIFKEYYAIIKVNARADGFDKNLSNRLLLVTRGAKWDLIFL
jgi:hypothetical protein